MAELAYPAPAVAPRFDGRNSQIAQATYVLGVSGRLKDRLGALPRPIIASPDQGVPARVSKEPDGEGI